MEDKLFTNVLKHVLFYILPDHITTCTILRIDDINLHHSN